MSTRQTFIIAVQLSEPERFREIFGEAVVAVAQEDLARGFLAVCESLLARYQILTEVASPGFGRWYLRFAPRMSSMSLDMDEQIPVLMAAGEERMRDLLLASFGSATGGHQAFRLFILPGPEAMSDLAELNPLIDQALSTVPCAQREAAISALDFQQLFEQQRLKTYFQPIVSLRDGTVEAMRR